MWFEFQDKVVEFNIKIYFLVPIFYLSGGNYLSTDIGREDCKANAQSISAPK